MVKKLKTYVNKYFSDGPKTAAIIVSVSIIILIMVIFSIRKTVTISVDGKYKNITTFSNTYGNILSSNGIKIGPKDKVSPSLNSKVHNNAKLIIKRALKVEVDVDGKKLSINSPENNICDMLKAEKIKLNSLDKVVPYKYSKLKKGLKIIITRVESKDIKSSSQIQYETVVKDDESIQQGSNRVIQEGQNGEKETVTRIMYENGKEVSRKVISEVIKKQPVQKVIAMGEIPDYSPSRGGNFSVVRSLNMKSTAYSADCESTGKEPGDTDFGITATGTVAKRGTCSSVAVDPRVIPLGTKLYVEGYGYAIAEDTGGAIKGNRIDLFFNSNSEANDWGVKLVNVYVIN